MTLRIALFGSNGHQIQNALVAHPLASLHGIADLPREKLPAALQNDAAIRDYESFEALLADPEVDAVSLCSARRRDQAEQAIRALRAGKHVFAEKPCAMTERDLDAILDTARETGRVFREMAGTAFEQPYFAMRQAVKEGRIGEVIQVIAEKSYPYFPERPQNEDVDGGLIGQNAIHALRMIEHVAGVRIQSVKASETTAGNPISGGGLRMASSLLLALENGGLATVCANYLNPRGTGVWGYESLRILGTKGMVESTAGRASTRLVIGDTDHGPLDTSGPGIDFLGAFFATCLGSGAMPTTLEEELSPTRWTIRAKEAAQRFAE